MRHLAGSLVVTAALASCGHQAPPDPALRALTPTEYNHTVRDLFGFSDNPDDWELPEGEAEPEEEEEDDFDEIPWPVLFPPEVGVNGFEGLSEGQVPSAYLVEEYQRAAADLAPFAHVAPYFWTCDDTATASQAELETCAWASVERFTHRAYRRPLDETESSRLRTFFDAQVAAYGVQSAVTLTVQGVLQTPQFLYQPEFGTQGSADNGQPLTSWEVASRLSYFLWDSMPDAELFEAASKDKLKTDAQVRRQARRMLKDPRARQAVVRFHSQWLELEDVYGLRADRRTYEATYGAPLEDTTGESEQDLEEVWSIALVGMRRSMVKDAELFVERTVFDGGGTLGALLTDNHSYVTQYTQKVYGVGNDALTGGTSVSESIDDGNIGYDIVWQPATLPPEQRAGLLTHPAVLAAKSHPVHPAPVLRGKFVLKRLACETMGQPPDSAAGTAPPDTLDATSTNRERLDAITSPSECSGCHNLINPAGFAFENYDSLGGYRTEDNGSPVDASGVLDLTTEEPIAFNDGVELATALSKSRQVHDCYALHWARYATGERLGLTDGLVIDLQKDFYRNNGDVQDLLVTIAASDWFRRKAGGAQ